MFNLFIFELHINCSDCQHLYYVLFVVFESRHFRILSFLFKKHAHVKIPFNKNPKLTKQGVFIKDDYVFINNIMENDSVMNGGDPWGGGCKIIMFLFQHLLTHGMNP